MANTDAAFGLRPVNSNGQSYCGRITRYNIPATDSTAVFKGDAVKLAGSADADGVATVAQAAAGERIVGVVVGFDKLDPDSLNQVHRAASTDAYVFVADDPDQIFEIQEDADSGALAADDVGQNADIIVAAGDTVTGISRMELDSSTAVGTSAQLQIMGFVQRPDNEIGANAKVRVRINEHEYRSTTGA